VIGNECSWWTVGEPSPDGRWMVAYAGVDGAMGVLHLIDLIERPVDLGEIENSRTTSHSAVWTDDGRVWFGNDASPTGNDRLWSLDPEDGTPVGVGVPGVPEGALLFSARIADSKFGSATSPQNP
jgi:hypothetical protein